MVTVRYPRIMVLQQIIGRQQLLIQAFDILTCFPGICTASTVRSWTRPKEYLNVYNLVNSEPPRGYLVKIS